MFFESPLVVAAKRCLSEESLRDGFTPASFADECFRMLGELGPKWVLLRLPSPPTDDESSEDEEACVGFSATTIRLEKEYPLKRPKDAHQPKTRSPQQERYFFPAFVAIDSLRVLEEAKRERSHLCRSPEKHAAFDSDAETIYDSDAEWLAQKYGENVHSGYINALAHPEAILAFLAERPESCVCELISESSDSFERVVSHVWTEDSLDSPRSVREELTQNFIPGWNYAHRPRIEELKFDEVGVGLRRHLQNLREAMTFVAKETNLASYARHHKLEHLAVYLKNCLLTFGMSSSYGVIETTQTTRASDSSRDTKIVQVAFPLAGNEVALDLLKTRLDSCWQRAKPRPDGYYNVIDTFQETCLCGKSHSCVSFTDGNVSLSTHGGRLLGLVYQNLDDPSFDLIRKRLPFRLHSPEKVRFLSPSARFVPDLQQRLNREQCPLRLFDSIDSVMSLFQ